MRRVGGAKPGFEAALRIEAMDPRVGSAALQQHVMAIHVPGFRQGGSNHRAAVTPALKRGMRHDIFEKSMPPAAPDSATSSLWNRKLARVFSLRLATKTTLPPSPPSPPSGPPRSTNFSCRKLERPSPPSPARTLTLALSINILLEYQVFRLLVGKVIWEKSIGHPATVTNSTVATTITIIIHVFIFD